MTTGEEACGHLFVGFGEGLSTKSPVVYFAKTKLTLGDDPDAAINAYNVGVTPVLGYTFSQQMLRRKHFFQRPPPRVCFRSFLTDVLLKSWLARLLVATSVRCFGSKPPFFI